MNNCPNAGTLFHLVPKNWFAGSALHTPENKRFVSQTSDGQPGLEVGFHVPTVPHGRAITTLGRDGNLILDASTPQNVLSRLHVAFEFDPGSHLILLTLLSRAAAPSSVRLQENGGSSNNPLPIIRHEFITYGTEYTVWIASYEFKLVWQTLSGENQTNRELLMQLALKGYRIFEARLKRARSRDCPTEQAIQEAGSWHNTRFNTAKKRRLEDVVELRERLTGADESAFGEIYKTVDIHTFTEFIVKKVPLDGRGLGTQYSQREAFHREVEMLEDLKHEHIIEFLGCNAVDTQAPEIFLPLRQGSLNSLMNSLRNFEERRSVFGVLSEQMLSALDHLSCANIIHRDIKPANILYMGPPDVQGYVFQLADFGISQRQPLPEILVIGPLPYLAPEAVPSWSGIDAPESHKSDIWSLAATFLELLGMYPPPKGTYPTDDPMKEMWSLNRFVVSQSKRYPILTAMAQMHPEQRASAAQLLIGFFGSRGLTSPLSEVPLLQPLIPDVTQSRAIAMPIRRAPPPQPQPFPGDAGPNGAINPFAERYPFGRAP
ncbi:hypothetical protein RB595_005296 [Gaeumannomyces hyphopodioides]